MKTDIEKTQKNIDMLHGPLAGPLLLFTLPIILSGVLQLLFNAADIIVVGRYAGSNALAAVGSNGALINLVVNLLIGLSVGSAVVVAFYYGAGQMREVRDTIHTSVAISVIGGIITGIVGIIFSPILLRWMGTPENILQQAELYLRIYFIGLPAMSIYNFGSAILRSLGDTKHPLYYLTIAGVVNIVLNLILVAVFHMDVAGVAIATTFSQCVSALLTLWHMMKLEDDIRLEWKCVRIHKTKLKRIVRVGLPAGIQSAIFSLSNVLIQSSVNGFGELAVAGNSSAANIEGFVYVSMNAFYHSAQTFTSQNVGARQYKRINKVLLHCLGMVTVTGLVLGWSVYFLGKPLLNIYLPANQKAIAYGVARMAIIARTYFLCGIMDVFSGSLRGMGESVLPMLVSMIGSCLLRVIWIWTVFASFHTLPVLYLSYPISWLVTEAVHFICYLAVKKRVTGADGSRA